MDGYNRSIFYDCDGVWQSMVPECYFDGTRDKANDDFVRSLDNIEINEKGEIISLIDKEDIELDNKFLEDYDKLGYDFKNLLPYCNNSIASDKGSYVEYKYPAREDHFLTEEAPVFKVSKIEASQVASCLIEQPDFELYSKVKSAGIYFEDELFPHAPFKGVDGQLKLCTDAILLMSTLEDNDKDDVKILVIGSASAESESGKAYKFIPYFINSGVVDLYDEYNDSTVINEKSKLTGELITFNYYKKNFNYNRLRKHDYKVIFDDSWVKDMDRSKRDSNLLVYTAKYFSIKYFPWEYKPDKGYIYYQRFKTASNECRIVSYRPVYRARAKYKMGNCPGCRELSLRLPQMTPGLITSYLEAHSKSKSKYNCRSLLKKKKLRTELEIAMEGYYKVKKVNLDLTGYVTLPFDRDKLDVKVVDVNEDSLPRQKFVFSKIYKLPEVVEELAYQIVILEEDYYYVKNLVPPFIKLEEVKYKMLEDDSRYRRFDYNSTVYAKTRQEYLNKYQSQASDKKDISKI